MCLHVCVCVHMCVNSMSFTPNIVNIHRTILHVLALHLEGGEKFWFTSLEHHKRGGEEEEGRAREKKKRRRRWRRRRRSVKLLFQGCEVILSLVESSVLVDRPFFLILLSNRGKSFLSGIANKKKGKTKNKLSVESSGLEPVVQHHRNVKEELEGGKRSLYILY